ncbi:MAG: NTP transferase domain-containing protein [Ignavibacteria bacterium]|nr:NTP transferase domain-containing protein [Bacteroidota bacterium]MBL7128476.1 NTP transferase domain-containing protein [Ignavibacteria bacterium]
MKLATVILAAGKGKRMKDPNKSKVMYELLGKPIIEYVVELAMKIDSDKVVIIVGHQKQSVIDFINKRFANELDKIKFAHQDEQLGTGHAIMQTSEELDNFNGDVLILSGDVPLLRYDTLEKFISFHFDNHFKASLLSAFFDNPFGYGRIIRDVNGKFTGIKEEKDADTKEKKIKEINSGIYLVKSKDLFNALKTLRTDNAQGEYYLTDIFKFFKNNNSNIGAVPVENNIEIEGINTVEQLQEMEKRV